MAKEKITHLPNNSFYLIPGKNLACFLGAFLLFFLSLSGCRLSYVLHAASGQLHVINNSIPLEDVLQGDTLSPVQKERLRLVAEIKIFGEEELGLRATDNYNTVYLESDQAPVYIISAAPKDQLTSITWWFPIVGRMPYLGFFDLDKAQNKQKDLNNKNLDVIIGKAGAYSTLGWFQDPVTLNLLDGTEVDLAEIILHEMTHTTIYLNGQGAFNESLANLIGKKGAVAFMENKYGPTHSLTMEAMYNLEDNRIFSLFLTSLFEKLERCYASSTSYQEKVDDREKIFNTSLKEFEEIKGLLRTDRYSYFGKNRLNNAYLLSIGLYNRHFLLIEMLLEKKNGSIRSTLQLLKDLSKGDEDIITEMINLLG
ncbi:aminopeptidase [Thermodesulfobacteriota bacterium]